jgi:hypothetical protein
MRDVFIGGRLKIVNGVFKPEKRNLSSPKRA